MNLRQFVQEAVNPYIAEHYPGFTFRGFGDPAGEQQAQSDGSTCFQILAAEGLPAVAASTNAETPRLDAVKQALNRRIGDMPGLLLSPRCKALRRGFNGRYFYERVQVSGDERYKDKPCKNKYSHVHDALQYACLSVAYDDRLFGDEMVRKCVV
jgi:hypothetical protein